MPLTFEQPNLLLNASLSASKNIFFRNRSNATESSVDSCFSLEYQMLAILGILFVIVIFSAILNIYVNIKHEKRQNILNQSDESSNLLTLKDKNRIFQTEIYSS